MQCPCCGAKMEKSQELEKSFLMRCTQCGLSNTVLK